MCPPTSVKTYLTPWARRTAATLSPPCLGLFVSVWRKRVKGAKCESSQGRRKEGSSDLPTCNIEERSKTNVRVDNPRRGHLSVISSLRLSFATTTYCGGRQRWRGLCAIQPAPWCCDNLCARKPQGRSTSTRTEAFLPFTCDSLLSPHRCVTEPGNAGAFKRGGGLFVTAVLSGDDLTLPCGTTGRERRVCRRRTPGHPSRRPRSIRGGIPTAPCRGKAEAHLIKKNTRLKWKIPEPGLDWSSSAGQPCYKAKAPWSCTSAMTAFPIVSSNRGVSP